MDPSRRSLVQAGVALGLLPSAEADEAPDRDPVPPLPTRPSPGRVGEFDFLHGEWRIDNYRPAAGGGWDRFPGEASCRTLLGGAGSVEELRIPARQFSGIGLRLLDRERGVWTDFWVHARSGVLAPPGQHGSFEQGVGIFSAEFEDGGVTRRSVGLWDRITPTSCRWRQAVSSDGGRHWTHDWVMHWTRVG